jgi:hypothetical protein
MSSCTSIEPSSVTPATRTDDFGDFSLLLAAYNQKHCKLALLTENKKKTKKQKKVQNQQPHGLLVNWFLVSSLYIVALVSVVCLGFWAMYVPPVERDLTLTGWAARYSSISTILNAAADNDALSTDSFLRNLRVNLAAYQNRTPSRLSLEITQRSFELCQYLHPLDAKCGTQQRLGIASIGPALLSYNPDTATTFVRYTRSIAEGVVFAVIALDIGTQMGYLSVLRRMFPAHTWFAILLFCLARGLAEWATLSVLRYNNPGVAELFEEPDLFYKYKRLTCLFFGMPTTRGSDLDIWLLEPISLAALAYGLMFAFVGVIGLHSLLHTRTMHTIDNLVTRFKTRCQKQPSSKLPHIVALFENRLKSSVHVQLDDKFLLDRARNYANPRHTALYYALWLLLPLKCTAYYGLGLLLEPLLTLYFTLLPAHYVSYVLWSQTD